MGSGNCGSICIPQCFSLFLSVRWLRVCCCYVPNIQNLKPFTLSPADGSLTPSDAGSVVEVTLTVAKNKSYELGLKLNLPAHDVESIHRTYSDPKDQILHIVLDFLNQEKPTWRMIVNALSSRLVNLPQLAQMLEKAHIPGSMIHASECH